MALRVAAMADLETFTYEGLDLNERSIRLITLQGGPPGSPVICDIAIYDTDTAPAYRALSYTWGRPRDEKAIALNGRCCMVRPNLYSFLEQKRQRDEEMLLWIDALCINQQNIPERNQVVAAMDLVYSRAEFVYAWWRDRRAHCSGFRVSRAAHRDGEARRRGCRRVADR